MQTQFTNPETYVENYYVYGVSLPGLLAFATLQRDSNTRLIFLCDAESEINFIKEALANPDGKVDNLIHYFNERQVFDEFWKYCNSIYQSFFIADSQEFFDDLESQCHVNNFLWLVDYEHVDRVRRTRLFSTEITTDGAIVEAIGSAYENTKYNEFQLTFRAVDTGATKKVRFKINTSFIAQKWARCCHNDYLSVDEAKFEKYFMLQNWTYRDDSSIARNIPGLCNELNKYIGKINEYFDGSNEDTRPYYNITQVFDPITLDQQILNEIHHHFELLIGQVWNPSRYFTNSPLPIMFAIRQLNNLCHEIEGNRQNSLGQGYWNAHVFLPAMPVKRYKFVESDFDNFTQYEFFGDVLLHYCQLGKTPLEAYYDKDGEIHDENISGLRYLSGECNITFLHEHSYALQTQLIGDLNRKMFPWLRERNVDPDSKFTSIGKIPVARIVRDDWSDPDPENFIRELFEYDDVCKLELVDFDNNVIVTKNLDYTWQDQIAVEDSRTS